MKLGQGTGDPETGGDNIIIEDVYLLTLFRRSRRRDPESQATSFGNEKGKSSGKEAEASTRVET